MWTDFYNEAKHLGNLFGKKGIFYGPKGHLGVDWNRHAAGTPIPSWTAGKVAYVGWSRNLGWIIIIARSDGTFAGFCHLQGRPAFAPGNKIRVGQIVGKVGNTGLFSSGPHLHCTLEPSVNIGTANAIDPLPRIRQAVAQAGQSTAGETMAQIQFYERTGTAQQEWMIGGRELPGGFKVTTDPVQARQWGRQYSGEGTVPVHLTRDLYVAQQEFLKGHHAEWLAQQKALLASVIGSDPATVAKAVESALADDFATVNANVNRPRTLQ